MTKIKNRFWINRHIRDHYVKKSLANGYRSRSAYKLLDIDKSNSILSGVTRVLDLGCAPGGWSQVLAKNLVKTAKIIAVDILDTELIDGVKIIKGDFYDPVTRDKIKDVFGDIGFELILSDISPNITGIRIRDEANLENMMTNIIDISVNLISKKGSLLFKTFNYPNLKLYINELKVMFESVKIIKPLASRSESSEVYVLAKMFLGPTELNFE